MIKDLILATSMGYFTQLLQNISSKSSNYYVAIASNKLAISQLKMNSNSNFNCLPEDFYANNFLNYSNQYISSLSDSLENTLGISIAQLISFDRRFCFGKNVKFTQSYSPFYSYDYSVRYILAIAHVIDKSLKDYSPSSCINFGSSNVADILLELYSKYYGVKFRQIKSAKVSNLVNSFPLVLVMILCTLNPLLLMI